MFQLDVEKAMRMGITEARNRGAMLSMAHDPVLGIVTMDSIKQKDAPDSTPYADNPPVAGGAGATDANIAAVARAQRDNSTSLASPDRSQKTSGQVDDQKLGNDSPKPTFGGGLLNRLAARKK